jgi:hypothetical protein
MPKNKNPIATDLKRLDAHIVQPHEYEDAPELTDAQLAAADVHEGGKLIRRQTAVTDAQAIGQAAHRS